MQICNKTKWKNKKHSSPEPEAKAQTKSLRKNFKGNKEGYVILFIKTWIRL